MAVTIRPQNEIPPRGRDRDGRGTGLAAAARGLGPGEAIKIDLSTEELEDQARIQRAITGYLSNAKHARRHAGLSGKLRCRIDRAGRALWIWIEDA